MIKIFQENLTWQKTFWSLETGQHLHQSYLGTVGAGITLLDAVLKDGYNTFSVSSITVTASIATVTTSGSHGLFANDNVAFSGANESVFNDRFTVLDVLSATEFRFAINTTTTPATGTITGNIPPLGWTKPFSGTNLAVYRAPAGNRFFLRVDDTNAQYMAVRMFETMYDVNTGTGGSSTVYWRKSSTSDSTARAWYVVGGARGFYFTSGWHESYSVTHYVHGFGDFVSYKENDLYNTILIGSNATSISVFGQNQGFSFLNNLPGDFGNTSYGQHIMRNFTGLLSSPHFCKFAAVQAGNINAWIDGNGTKAQMGFNFCWFPNPATNGITLKPMDLAEGTYGGYIAHRGIVPGAYTSAETTGWNISSGFRITINNKKFMGVITACQHALNYQHCTYRGSVFFDITSDWWA